MSFAVGDVVTWWLETGPGEGTVIGVMSYSDTDEVINVASEQYVGMPLNKAHCTKTGGCNVEDAMRWRERYLTKFPGTMKDTP